MRYLNTPKLIMPILPTPSYYICYIILIKLLKLRSLYTWNLFHTWGLIPMPKTLVWACGMNLILLIWVECKTLEQGFSILVDFRVHSYAIRSSEENFPHVRFPFALCLSCYKFPYAYALVSLHSVMLIYSSDRFPQMRSAPAIWFDIFRCTVCALTIYCGIVRTYKLSAMSRRENSNVFTSPIVLLNGH